MAIMLKAKTREQSSLRKVRSEGAVPAVVYGKDIASKSIAVDNLDFVKTMKNSGKNSIISLETEGETYEVITHDIQRDPLKGELIHIDFYKVDMKAEMDSQVPIQLIGEPVGVKDGGIVQQTLYEVSVRSLPADIPEFIELDVNHLMIGDSLQVQHLVKGEKYEINNDPDEGILSILPPPLNNEPDEQQEMADKEEVQAEAENSAQDE